jgi:hypothetical protein
MVANCIATTLSLQSAECSLCQCANMLQQRMFGGLSIWGTFEGLSSWATVALESRLVWYQTLPVSTRTVCASGGFGACRCCLCLCVRPDKGCSTVTCCYGSAAFKPAQPLFSAGVQSRLLPWTVARLSPQVVPFWGGGGGEVDPTG